MATNDELRAAATELMLTVASRIPDNQKIRIKEGRIYEVCRQWLAEHPEDDEEPVTKEWLRSIGFVNSISSVLVVGDMLSVSMPGRYWVFSCCGMPTRMKYETRGDVRRLCAALGIELKGGS